MEDIFFSQYDSEVDKHIVIEGNEHAVWAYIVNSQSNEVEMDGFLCSRGLILDAIQEVNSYVEKGIAPPISKEYASRDAVRADIKTEDLSVVWEADSVFVMIGEEEFLEMDITEKKAFSKAVATSGPFGEPYLS